MSTVGRDFYEDLSRRRLDARTIRAIMYRNHTLASYLAGPPERILEIGPGEGWLTELLAGRGHQVTVIDMARGWLGRDEAARAHRTQGSMTALPFASGRFDVVIAAEVIEHIPDHARALAEAARVLRPGGRLLVTVPYREVLRYVTDRDTGERREVNGHLHTFDETTLAAAMIRAGTEPVTRFVGPTRLTREIVYRVPGPAIQPLLRVVDRVSSPRFHVGDTWMLMIARRP